MKKFNGYEKYLILEGLKLVEAQGVKEIEEIEASGKNPIMTIGFIKGQIRETVEKVEELSLKERK